MQTYGRHWSDEASVSGKPPIEMHGSNFAPFPINHAPALLGDLLPQLQGLVLLSNASISDFMETKIKPPNKTKSLERNAYVLNLARRVKIFCLAARQQASRGPGFHLNQILAITANVALALEGPDELKADTVRKLIADNH